jgi:hypothetical protein
MQAGKYVDRRIERRVQTTDFYIVVIFFHVPRNNRHVNAIKEKEQTLFMKRVSRCKSGLRRQNNPEPVPVSRAAERRAPFLI